MDNTAQPLKPPPVIPQQPSSPPVQTPQSVQPIEPVQPPTTLPSSSVSPISKKGKSFPFPLHSVTAKIILGIILVITFGGGGVFVLSQQSTSPQTKITPTPAPGCRYQEVTCMKSPCPKVLICAPTQPPLPSGAPTLIPTFAPPTPTVVIVAPTTTPIATPSAKVYTNGLNGYSFTYPFDFKISTDSANLFEIQNPALIMTFVSESATDTAKATILKRPKFCPLGVMDIDATVSGKVAYRRDGKFADGASCLEVVIPNVNKILDIKGKPTAASASAGIDLFNQILNTFHVL